MTKPLPTTTHDRPARSFGRKILRWCRLTATVLGLLILGLAGVGALYEMIGSMQDSRRFPQKGRLVQAGKIKLNIDCAGQTGAGPTVILENAGGVPARGWAKVQPDVAKFTRVCSYDRAGVGWSDPPGPEPRTGAQIAKELTLLLQAAGEKGPYIMVGHSIGGYFVQSFTHQNPDAVAGVVLVDASHPDTIRRTLEILPEASREEYLSQYELAKSAWADAYFTWTTRLGLTRLLVPAPDDFAREINYLSSRSLKAMGAEFKADAVTEKEIRELGNHLGDRPLIVLTGGKIDEGLYASRAEEVAQQRLWAEEIQPELAKLSSQGKQIIVPDSGHMIPYERPDAVVSAIREVWTAAKASSPAPLRP
jgi:pimeloyl-ACP methyl ester carboxylesterase